MAGDRGSGAYKSTLGVGYMMLADSRALGEVCGAAGLRPLDELERRDAVRRVLVIHMQ